MGKGSVDKKKLENSKRRKAINRLKENLKKEKKDEQVP